MDKANHTHYHGATAPISALRWGVALNLAYVVAEAAAGFANGSIALVSDAGHNLADVISLLLALVGFGLSRRRPTARLTYGLGKSTILISLFNALLLLVGMGAIAYEGVQRMLHPVPVDGSLVAWVAGAGIVVNGLSAALLVKHQHGELNARGAFLHLAGDAAVSAGVVASGLAMRYLHAPWLDGLASVAIAIIVVVSTWGLLRESLRLSLDGVPATIDLGGIKSAILAQPGVEGVHHIHTWALSTTEVALTAHVVVADTNVDASSSIKQKLKHELAHLGVAHATLEMEKPGEECGEGYVHK